MEFDLTEEQRAIRDLGRDFALAELAPNAAQVLLAADGQLHRHHAASKRPAERLQQPLRVGALDRKSVV